MISRAEAAFECTPALVKILQDASTSGLHVVFDLLQDSPPSKASAAFATALTVCPTARAEHWAAAPQALQQLVPHWLAHLSSLGKPGCLQAGNDSATLAGPALVLLLPGQKQEGVAASVHVRVPCTLACQVSTNREVLQQPCACVTSTALRCAHAAAALGYEPQAAATR